MNPPASSSTQRRGRLALRLFLLVALVLAIFLYRGSRSPSAVDRYTAELRARGEKLTLAELGLDRTARPDPIEDMLDRLKLPLRSLRTAALPPAPKVNDADGRPDFGDGLQAVDDCCDRGRPQSGSGGSTFADIGALDCPRGFGPRLV